MKYIKNKKYAFTLVELIIVITILAILATISFISFKNYSKSSRDTNRVSTLKNMEKWLDIFALKTWKYPNPEWEVIELSWSWDVILLKKWILQDTISRQIQSDQTPKDPLTQKYYAYATTENNQEWQLATLLEDDLVWYNNVLIPQTYADGSYKAYVIWNYKPKVFTTPDTSYFLPSLIFNFSGSIVNNKVELNTQNSQDIYYVVNKDINLPYSVNGNTWINNTSTNNLSNIKDIVNNAWDDQKENVKNFLQELTEWKPNSEITPENKTLIETYISSSNQNASNTNNNPPIANSCATQPSYTWAIFTNGTATQPNQSWQTSDENAACYWTCGSGKVLDEGSCVTTTCAWEAPDGTAKISNATTFAGWTWNYSETGWKCTYSCGSGYSYSWWACVDITPPTWWSFTINSWAASTSSANVTLNITCPVDSTIAQSIQVAYWNTSNPTNWVNCTSSLSHTLTTGSGTKNVYVRFRDGAVTPNVTQEITQSITFTPPTLVWIIVWAGIYWGTNNLTLSWTVSYRDAISLSCTSLATCSWFMTINASQPISNGYRVLYRFDSPEIVKSVSIREWWNGTHNYRPSFAYYYSDGTTIDILYPSCGAWYSTHYTSWDVNYTCTW